MNHSKDLYKESEKMQHIPIVLMFFCFQNRFIFHAIFFWVITLFLFFLRGVFPQKNGCIFSGHRFKVLSGELRDFRTTEQGGDWKDVAKGWFMGI